MITAVLPQTTDNIPAVLPSALSPLSRYYRGYRGNTAVPITVQLTSIDTPLDWVEIATNRQSVQCVLSVS